LATAMGNASNLRMGPAGAGESRGVHRSTKAALQLLLVLSGTVTLAQSASQQELALQAAAQREPNDVRSIAALGEYYFHEQKWAASARWLTSAYALSNGDTKLGHDLALSWMQAGALDKAKAQIDTMQEKGESAKLHALMAEVDDRSGAYQEAAREYHRAAEMEPTEPRIFDLATYLVQHKQYVGALDDAIKFYRYGVQQFPQSAQMRVGLGVALYAANEYDEAVRVLCEAVDLDPKDPRPLQFLGRASRVSPELAHEVDARLKEFADRYPENAAANYFYALSLWERGGGTQGRGQDVIERLLRRAEELDSKWYEPHYQLGVVYESEQRYADAVRELKQAVTIDPEFFPAHYRLAVLYKRTGEKTRAAAEGETVRRLKAKENENGSRHEVTE